MMLWMYNDAKEPYIDVRSRTPQDICLGTPTRSGNSSKLTGSSEDDKLANVYDTLGCSCDWGMTAVYASYREARGGYKSRINSPSARENMEPNESFDFYSSRLVLWI